MRDKSGRLPDVIMVGPQRTATTWLYEILRDHLGMPHGVKETMFFDRRYAKGIGWYATHFRRAPLSLPVAEVAPTYFHSAAARERIRRHIPRCRIVCTLRDPTTRLYSLYRLMREYSATRAQNLEAAVRAHPEMLESSRYATHVAAWRKVLGAPNVLIMLNDDLVANPQRYIDTICRFCGIRSFRLTEEQKRPTAPEAPARSYYVTRTVHTAADWMRANRLYAPINVAKRLGLRRLLIGGGRNLPPMTTESEARWRDYFLPDVEALERLIGRDLSAWKPPQGIGSLAATSPQARRQAGVPSI